MSQDVQRNINFVVWSLCLGFLIFLGLILWIFFMEWKGPPLHTLLFTLAFIVSAVLTRKLIYVLALRFNSERLQRFDEDKEIGIYTAVMEKRFSPERPIPHAVLLLHGFGASPEEFEYLTRTLKSANIPFYAPNLTGFGLNTLTVLHNIRYQDWLRCALSAYDSLKMFCENVSVVGHSMGAVLAGFVATRRPVKHLIYSAPGFYPIAEDLPFKKILLKPVLSRLFCWLIPFLPKPKRKGRATSSDLLDSSMANKIFRYPIVPTQAAKQLFKMQEDVNPLKTKNQTLTIIYGAQDLTVNVKDFVQLLKTNHVEFKEYCLENSAHNTFEDFERERASEIVKQMLLS